MTDLTPLARDEADCFAKLMHGLDLTRDAACQLALQYRQDQGPMWMQYVGLLDQMKEQIIKLSHSKLGADLDKLLIKPKKGNKDVN